MTEQAQTETLELLVFSDDSTVRTEVIEGVGSRPVKELPPVKWTEAATAEGVRMAISQRAADRLAPFKALILDGEVKKFSGTGLAHELLVELESRPPVVLLTARPQDEWLANWAQADAIVERPLEPQALQKAVVGVLR